MFRIIAENMSGKKLAARFGSTVEHAAFLFARKNCLDHIKNLRVLRVTSREVAEVQDARTIDIAIHFLEKYGVCATKSRMQ